MQNEFIYLGIGHIIIGKYREILLIFKVFHKSFVNIHLASDWSYNKIDTVGCFSLSKSLIFASCFAWDFFSFEYSNSRKKSADIEVSYRAASKEHNINLGVNATSHNKIQYSPHVVNIIMSLLIYD